MLTDSEILKQRMEDAKKKIKARRRIVLFQKWILSVVLGVFAFAPTIGFFILKHELDPQTFWEKFAVWGGGIALFGGIQLIFIVVFVQLLISVVWDD